MKICISGVKDIGLHRTENEDDFSFCPDLNVQTWDKSVLGCYKSIGKLGAMAILADGMGGANAGELASSIVIDSIRKECTPTVLSSVGTTEDNIRDFMIAVISKAKQAIIKHVESDPTTIGMGTTVVLLWLINNTAHIAWCGDSRCYVFNPKNGLKCLSKDHSYVQELIDNGKITLAESYNHPDSSVITRCLGDCDVSSEPDIVTYKINQYDTFLLCSDGLCGYCLDEQIEEVLFKHYISIQECCKKLVTLALSKGGEDNISVVLLSTIGDDEDHIQMGVVDKIKRYIKRLYH